MFTFEINFVSFVPREERDYYEYYCVNNTLIPKRKTNLPVFTILVKALFNEKLLSTCKKLAHLKQYQNFLSTHIFIFIHFEVENSD